MNQNSHPFSIDGNTLVLVVVSALGVFVLTILLTRIFGLRSFARISTFDFAFTLAKGALIATVAVSDVNFFKAASALVIIYAAEWISGYLRKRFPWLKKLLNNQPVLLFYEGKFLEENLKKTRITNEDVYFALRQKDASKLEEVKAVVLETTGQISVLTGEDETVSRLLKEVKK